MRLGWGAAEAAFLAIAGVAFFYYAAAVVSAIRLFRRRPPAGAPLPPISILKPIRGLDPDAGAALASFCEQDYPEFEILFGAADADDPGLAAARRVAQEHPDLPIRFVSDVRPLGANPKVSTLARIAAEAKHDLLLVSDSDIIAGPGHLRAMAECLEDRSVGVVTCLYRSQGEGPGGRLDALGLSTEFQPSVLAARLVEGVRFGLGAGILIRRAALESIGGFGAIADTLADDYWLGALPARSGWRVALAPEVVEHRLGRETFGQFVRHQLRWNRGIRSCRPGGYAGLLLTQATAAGLAGLIASRGSAAGWIVCGLALAMRLVAARVIAGGYLGDRNARRFLWLVPVRDLLGAVLWGLGLFGRTIEWRGGRYRLLPGGRLAAEGAGRSAP